MFMLRADAYDPTATRRPLINGSFRQLCRNVQYMLLGREADAAEQEAYLRLMGTGALENVVMVVFEDHYILLNVNITKHTRLIITHRPPLGGEAALYISGSAYVFYLDKVAARPWTGAGPRQRRGTFFARLAVALVRSLGAHTMHLRDSAMVELGGTPVSLLALRLVHGCEPWYANFGFAPACRETLARVRSELARPLADSAREWLIMDDFEYRMEQAHDPVTGLSKEDMLLLLRRPPHGVTVADALLDLHRSGRHGAFQALFSMLLCTGMHQWRGTLFMVRDFTEEAAM